MSMYGPNELNTELNRIEQAASQPSSSSNAYAQSLERVRAYFADQDSNLQAKRVILQQRLERWRQGNAQLAALARDLGPLLPIQPQVAPSLFSIREDYIPVRTAEEAGAAKERETREQEALKQFTVFEEYRRLSYDLNSEEKIDGQRIRRAEPNSGYDFIVRVKIPGGSEKEQEEEYFAKRIMTTNNDLVPFILVPVDKSKIPCEVRLTFQGTSSLNGWYRNFTGQNSAGINEFLNNRERMIDQIAEEISKIKTPINLSIIGHSLGGADSQNMMVALMDALDKKNENLRNIKNMNLYVYNSAGVSKETKEQSLVLAEKMHHQGVGVHGNFSIVGGDVVQQTGDTNILIGMPAEHGRLTLVKTNAGFEGAFNAWRPFSTAYDASAKTLSAHIGQFFTENRQANLVASREFFLNDNADEARIMQEKLSAHKLAQKTPLSYTFGQNLKGGIKLVGQYVWEGSARDLVNLVQKVIADAQQNHISEEDVVRQIEDILWLEPKLLDLFFDDKNNFFIDCVKQDKNNIAKKLCECALGYGLQANPLSRQDSTGMTALHYAARNGNEELVKLLRDAKVSRSLQDDEGNTILHYYAKNRVFSAERFIENLFVAPGLTSGLNATSPNILLKMGEEKGNALVDCIIQAGRLDIINAILEKDRALQERKTEGGARGWAAWGSQFLNLGRGEESLTSDLRKRLQVAKHDLEASVPPTAPRSRPGRG